MSKLKEFRELEHALKLQQEKLDMLAHDERLGRELEFEKKLMSLLKRYQLDLRGLQDFIRPVEPSSARLLRQKRTSKTQQGHPRAPLLPCRQLKTRVCSPGQGCRRPVRRTCGSCWLQCAYAVH